MSYKTVHMHGGPYDGREAAFATVGATLSFPQPLEGGVYRLDHQEGEHYYYRWRPDVPDWEVPEYHPPPRVEAWLTLPPGVVVARDDPDWEPYDRFAWSREWIGVRRLDSDERFVKEFGLKTAVDWGLVPSPFSWIMKDVFCDSIRDQMHDASRLLWSENEVPTTSFTVPLKKKDNAGR